MNLAETIKTAREGLNLTQEELAEKLEVSRQAVSKWEMGASAPSPENLALLSEILGVPLETGTDTPLPAAEPGRNLWKIGALVLAGLTVSALLCAGVYFSLIHPGSTPVGPVLSEDPMTAEPVITDICFFGEDGTPLHPDLGDGWCSFSPGERIYLLVSFRQGTETDVHGIALFATPTGTETYSERAQLAVQPVYDRTFALFPLEFSEENLTHAHLDITLECDQGRTVTETLNITTLSPVAPGETPAEADG